MKTTILVVLIAFVFTLSQVSAVNVGGCSALSVPLTVARQALYDEIERQFLIRGVHEAKLTSSPLIRDSIDTACNQVLNNLIIFRFTATYHYTDSDQPVYVSLQANYVPRTKANDLIRYTVSDTPDN